MDGKYMDAYHRVLHDTIVSLLIIMYISLYALSCRTII